MLKEGEIRIPSGCAIAAIIDRKGNRINGSQIIKSIALMHDRSNGLGGGFAAYGIYPEHKDEYAIHVFYDSNEARKQCEDFLFRHFNIDVAERIPTRQVPSIEKGPDIWRYFGKANRVRMKDARLDELEYVAQCVTKVNNAIEGAYIFSSGKNMGCFKAVGYPEDVGEFYMLDQYEAYIWTAHGRFPTNTPGWWGGAHPFNILDWSIVHNGEISSYDANRRYIEQFGYICTMQTDTEVITYLFDHLLRHHNLPIEVAADVLTAPEWDEIDRMDDDKKKYFTDLRSIYNGALVNGPFSVILGSNKGLLAINDRLKLRSLTAQLKETVLILLLKNRQSELFALILMKYGLFQVQSLYLFRLKLMKRRMRTDDKLYSTQIYCYS